MPTPSLAPLATGRDGVGLRLDPAALVVVAAVLIGGAIQVRLGRFDGLALGMAVLGTALVAVAIPSWHRPRIAREMRRRRLAHLVLAVHVLSLVPLVRAALAGTTSPLRMVVVPAALAGVLLAWDQLRPVPTSGAWGRAGLVAAFGLLGLFWIATVPTNIDVFHYQDIGTERLLDGTNPYAPGYPNPYDGIETHTFFAPGLSVDGVLQFGFPYPPLSLLLAVPGALLGDVRLAHLAAVAVAGWLLLTMVEDSWASRVGGVLFLSTPMLLPLVQRAWTEAFLILAVVALAWLLRRGRGLDAVALGLFVAVKQYAAMFLPVLLWVAPHWRTAAERWRALGIAVAVATAVTLPLALWDLGDFLFSVVLLQFRQPFRDDAMSLPALAERTLGWSGEALALVGILVAVAVAMWWVVRRAPRTWPAAATGMALVMLAFLLFNKQAFTNYYMLAVAMLWLGVALRDDAGAAVPASGE